MEVIKANKGIMNSYKAIKESESDYSYIIVKAEDYELLTERLDIAFKRVDYITAKAKQEVEEYKTKANKVISTHKEKIELEKNVLQKELDKAKAQIEYLNGLNENLLRISKERANAKRGLKPKKAHKGYLVLDSTQQVLRVNKRAGRKIESTTYPYWKVRIQTHYDSSIPYKVVVNSIRVDLLEFLCDSLGIDKVYKNSLIDSTEINELNSLWVEDINFIFKILYKQNIKSGFWELEFWTRFSINIPLDMRNL